MGQIVAGRIAIAPDRSHIVQPDTDCHAIRHDHRGEAARLITWATRCAWLQEKSRRSYAKSWLETGSDPDDLIGRNGRIVVRGNEDRGMAIGG
jgi:hypothetical protein